MDIAHRDIKPENIVLSHVTNLLFRELLNYVTLDGLLDVKIEDRPTVEHLIMLLLRYYKVSSIINVWIFGV